MKEISFVILTWNSEKDIAECLESIITQVPSENMEILVVDNGSDDLTVSLLEEFKQKNPDILKIWKLDRNYGTTYSRNLALKYAQGEILVVMDSDTKILRFPLESIKRFFGKYPEVGLLAPRLRLSDNSIQHNVKKFPTMQDKILKLNYILFKNNRFRDRDFYPDFPFSSLREVETAISAGWILRRAAMEKVGYLDERIFYSPEDLDYSLRMYENGYRIVYFPLVEILHKTKQITHKSPFSKVAVSHFKGLFYYYFKHGYFFSREKLLRKYGITGREYEYESDE